MDGIKLEGSCMQSKDYSVDIPENVCTPTRMTDLKATCKYSVGVNSLTQKKELCMKLDEILIEALHKEFEVVPGHSIDRLDMVKFLTDVVHHHMGDCPDLEKVLTLRDTVLTGRIKRAFPEVEYKRKQLRQDHYRKAWLYVNLRRKPSTNTGCYQDKLRETTISSSTWTPPALPGSAPPSQTSSSPSSPTSREESPSPHSYVNTLFEQDNTVPVVIDDGATIHYHGALEDTASASSGEASLLANFSSTHLPEEKTALVLDNLSIQKWVVSNYIEDGSSFVPVQDVVKAFKEEYHYDISYKDCHQMIYSAFTSPRNRSSPMKTVRVTSLGQQYVYRGIAPRKKVLSGEGSEQDSCQSDDDQLGCKSEDWKHVLEEAREERDLALLERNQALAALMELEKEHAQALRTIEKLKTDNLRRNVSKGSRNETPSKDRDLRSDHEEGSSLDKLLRKFGDAERASVFAGKHQEPDYVKERKDAIWRDIVVQTQEELDALLKRLEMVKKERNSYLERLHSLEKTNQELRDAVTAPRSEGTHHRLFADIAGFKSNCGAENDTKEALSSVLAHLRSKRKQASPAKFSKVPKFDHTSLTTENKFREKKTHSVLSPAAMLGVTSSPGVSDDSNVALIGVRKRDCHVKNVPNGADDDSDENGHNLLVYAVGSGLVGFSPHPLED